MLEEPESNSAEEFFSTTFWKVRLRVRWESNMRPVTESFRPFIGIHILYVSKRVFGMGSQEEAVECFCL